MKLTTLQDLEKLSSENYSVLRINHRMPFDMEINIESINKMREATFLRRLAEGYIAYLERNGDYMIHCHPTENLQSRIFLAPVASCHSIEELYNAGKELCDFLEQEFIFSNARIELWGKYNYVIERVSPLTKPKTEEMAEYNFYPASLKFSQEIASLQLPPMFKKKKPIKVKHKTEIYLYPSIPSGIQFNRDYLRIMIGPVKLSQNKDWSYKVDISQWFKGKLFDPITAVI